MQKIHTLTIIVELTVQEKSCCHGQSLVCLGMCVDKVAGSCTMANLLLDAVKNATTYFNVTISLSLNFTSDSKQIIAKRGRAVRNITRSKI